MQKAHSTYRLYDCEDFQTLTHGIIQKLEGQSQLVTFVFWGHGNKLDKQNGYLKIYSRKGACNFLFINDLIRQLKELSGPSLTIQLLLTQCWAHCHDRSLHQFDRYMVVDWFTSENCPETSARRWDSVVTGKEMTQEEFERFMSEERNYEAVQNRTKSQYCSNELKVYLKYLHYSSIHVEATIYLLDSYVVP